MSVLEILADMSDRLIVEGFFEPYTIKLSKKAFYTILAELTAQTAIQWVIPVEEKHKGITKIRCQGTFYIERDDK